ncbi:MAG TPA: ribonuclease III [Nitrospirae bacterium]|nr:ribonuclease 3 [bacterium BMS3Abin06]HDH13628.1 ribonuclease III [Nitrospirota bacterium]HDZ00916.1 ribonuclease III [Nitrospirota bacterium]
MRVSSSKNLTGLENSIGYTFKKKSLLKEALTHKSYAHEKSRESILFNERLEFLGDAVLELIVSENLFSAHSEYTEADLSKIKAYVVQESTLAQTAKDLDIGAYLCLGKGEEITGGRKKPSLLADAFEALLAAIYLDGGYKKAKKFVLDHLMNKIEEIEANRHIFDFKTKLQEIAQAQFGVLPRYIIHKEEGPEHKKTFEVKVFIKDDFLGSGKGKTKKAAAQKAAGEGLKKIEEGNETNL